jgi:hypothetical protein
MVVLVTVAGIPQQMRHLPCKIRRMLAHTAAYLGQTPFSVSRLYINYYINNLKLKQTSF